MKIIKLISLLALTTILGVSCSISLSSESSNSKENSGCKENVWGAVTNAKIDVWNTLYTIVPDSSLNKQQKKWLGKILKGDTLMYLSAHVAHINPNIGTLLRQADTLAFPVSVDSMYVAIRTKLTKHRGPNNKSIIYTLWAGSILHSSGEIHLVYSKQGGLTGEITPVDLCDKGFVLRGFGHGTEAIIRIKVNHKAVR